MPIDIDRLHAVIEGRFCGRGCGRTFARVCEFAWGTMTEIEQGFLGESRTPVHLPA